MPNWAYASDAETDRTAARSDTPMRNARMVIPFLRHQPSRPSKREVPSAGTAGATSSDTLRAHALASSWRLAQVANHQNWQRLRPDTPSRHSGDNARVRVAPEGEASCL